MTEISACLADVQSKIALASSSAGSSAQKVQLIAVSKTWPASDVAQAVAAGQLVFGENRVQEAEGKIPELGEDLSWHLIGGLQKNKVRKALELFDCLQTIDSLALATRVSRLAGEMERTPQIFLQCNLAAEPQKGGFLREDLERDLESMCALPHLQVQGLMAIPPAAGDEVEARRHFADLRAFRDALEISAGRKFPCLSMGMSGDYEIAIQEGATHVRVGSSIFGRRTNG